MRSVVTKCPSVGKGMKLFWQVRTGQKSRGVGSVKLETSSAYSVIKNDKKRSQNNTWQIPSTQ